MSAAPELENPEEQHAPDRKLTYADVIFEEGPCPLCAERSPGPPILTGSDAVWRKEGTFTLVRCQGCGLVYQNPRPTRETMRYYYEDCYSGKNEEEMRKFALESPFAKLMSVYRVAVIEKVRALAPGQRVLDIGASYGAFIEHARVKRGIEAYAIDLDPGTIEKFGGSEEIDVRCGDVLEGMYPAEHFDVVTLFETLEHVYDPVVVLEEVKRILKPGGLVSLEVPNWDGVTRMVFGSWWLPLLLPTHLQHFSRRHLAMCAERAGLEPAFQQAMFYPGEIMMSVGVGYGRICGNPPEERGVGRRVLDKLVGLVLLAIFVMVDLPVIFVLRLFGRSGHQTLIARKPTS